ncbi:hypothetical protein BAE44_0007410 [Dichanthelium oligosanthes]|uniref:Uncharacterized protein n=1 Tax=Dichanthelium oligosanthes TaxID=888268 RepID=A0A1E5W2J1_9POAL|nr:hypothetical protein BAE44_0007410 [Dichanthelium oligosanthes]
MCYQVKCGTCGKPSWEGCGRHVASVHAQIPEGQHCACRDWPGVAPPVGKKPADAAADAGKTSGTAAAEGSAGSAEGGAVHELTGFALFVRID